VHCNLRSCPHNFKAQAYTTLVKPVLEYASTAIPTSTTPVSVFHFFMSIPQISLENDTSEKGISFNY
jgi:hypothetical protein